MATMGPPLVVALTIWVPIQTVILHQFNELVSEPYMDEPFHFPQTEAYCNGNWSHWDHKITTPPGLYVLGVAWSKFIGEIQQVLGGAKGSLEAGTETCTLSTLRSVNVFVNSLCLVLVVALIQKRSAVRGVQMKSVDVLLGALALCTLPTHYFFSFLYYTDAPGLFLVLLMYYLSQSPGDFWKAPLAGLFSVFFRQTNVIWVCFVAGTLMTEHMVLVWNKSDYNSVHHIPLAVVTQWKWLLQHGLGFGLIVVAFVAFVIVNEGIVLGDKTNHEVAVHGAQLCYFATVACIFTGSVWEGLDQIQSANFKFLSRSTVLPFAVFSFFAVHFTTLTHQFLLSDNRHYTFYVWRYFILRHPGVRYALLPLYVLSMCFILVRARASKLDAPWLLVYLVALILTLTPSPLVEPRYFTVAFFILGVNLKWSRGTALVTIAMNCVINFCTIYLFLYRPFVSPDGTVGRFMW